MASNPQAARRPSYSIESATNTAAGIVKLTVLRGRTQFHITADLERLEGSELHREYVRQIFQVEDEINRQRAGLVVNEPPTEPHEFLCEQLLPLFRRLAPDREPPLQGLTLHDLINAPTYTLELVAGEPGSGNDLVVRGEEDGFTYRPSHPITPGPTQGLPESCKGIRHIDASEVCVDPMITEGNNLSSTLFGGKVRVADGTTMFFKPRTLLKNKKSGQRTQLNQLNFEREIDILGRFNQLDLIHGEMRLPNLVGIVVSGEMVVGMLLEINPLLSREESLLTKRFWENETLCKKWELQITRMIELLHAHNIVWGCVGPAGVRIDENLDAWIVHFEGGNNRDFVDEELIETKEGDWQGLQRMFRKWLPSRRVDVHRSVNVF